MNNKSIDKPVILIVDDEENIRLLLENVLCDEELKVASVEDGRKALNYINKNRVAIVIMDIRMPRLSGLEVLKIIKDKNKDALVIILTAFATIKTAVEAMKIGAFDYLTKPFEVEEIKAAVNRALKVWNLMEENRNLKAMINKDLPDNMLVSNNSNMLKLQAMLKKVAVSDYTVMISGETGTGKSLLAKAIHYYSNRNKQAFVWLNCATLPEHLVESELFGYEKGAFTGATQQKKGQMEMADGGTLFLDEISILSPSAQGKLLLALQEGEFQRVGGNKPVKVDVRIIAASNHDLKTMVEEKNFRSDLFYRLNVINLELPSLKERPEDIVPLAQHFINSNTKTEGEGQYLTPEAAQKLLNYHWPGNIRELENIIKQAMVLVGNDGWIRPGHFIFCEKPKKTQTYVGLQQETLKEALLRLQREIITNTVNECDNQIAEAAEKLGVSVRTIYRHLRS